MDNSPNPNELADKFTQELEKLGYRIQYRFTPLPYREPDGSIPNPSKRKSKTAGKRPTKFPAKEIGEPITDTDTVSEARKKMDKLTEDGTICPVCGQVAEKHTRALNTTMAFAAVLFYSESTQSRHRPWLHLEAFLKATFGVDQAVRGDVSKLVEWGILERYSKTRGFYRLTEFGKAFVQNLVEVPNEMTFYCAKVLRVSPEKRNIETIFNHKERSFDPALLGTRFDYWKTVIQNQPATRRLREMAQAYRERSEQTNAYGQFRVLTDEENKALKYVASLNVLRQGMANQDEAGREQLRKLLKNYEDECLKQLKSTVDNVVPTLIELGVKVHQEINWTEHLPWPAGELNEDRKEKLREEKIRRTVHNEGLLEQIAGGIDWFRTTWNCQNWFDTADEEFAQEAWELTSGIPDVLKKGLIGSQRVKQKLAQAEDITRFCALDWPVKVWRQLLENLSDQGEEWNADITVKLVEQCPTIEGVSQAVNEMCLQQPQLKRSLLAIILEPPRVTRLLNCINNGKKAERIDKAIYKGLRLATWEKKRGVRLLERLRDLRKTVLGKEELNPELRSDLLQLLDSGDNLKPWIDLTAQPQTPPPSPAWVTWMRSQNEKEKSSQVETTTDNPADGIARTG